MLQVGIHDAGYRDIFAVGLIGYQAADTADNQIDLHARLTGTVERIDHFLVLQTVHLQYDLTDTSMLYMFNLPVNHFINFGNHVELRHQQMLEIVHIRLSLQHAKDLVNIFDDLFVRCQQSLVGIDAGRFFVEVARTQVGIPFDRIIGVVASLTHVGQLGMHLQSRQAVDDLHPRLLHQLRG